MISACLNHYYVAQVYSPADGTKITNTGTNLAGGSVNILAHPLRPSASEGPRRRLPRAQVFGGSGTEITVSTPGKADIYVRDPRPLRPPARNEGTRTQDYVGSGVTFECYDTPMMVPPFGSAFCP